MTTRWVRSGSRGVTALAVLGAVLAGAALATPVVVGALLALSTKSAYVVWAGLWVFGVCVLAALWLRAQRGRPPAVPQADEAVVWHEVHRGVAGAVLASALPVVALIVWAAAAINLPTAILFAAVLQGLWVWLAGYVGYHRGLVLVRQRREQAALARLRERVPPWLQERLDRWGERASLRVAVCECIEARFGPLGAEARARLGSWTEERLAEAGGKLASAKSLSGLGLEG
jgi:hypothetical protein